MSGAKLLLYLLPNATGKRARVAQLTENPSSLFGSFQNGTTVCGFGTDCRSVAIRSALLTTVEYDFVKGCRGTEFHNLRDCLGVGVCCSGCREFLV